MAEVTDWIKRFVKEDMGNLVDCEGIVIYTIGINRDIHRKQEYGVLAYIETAF